MGLGERGKDKVKEAAAPELFRKTEHLTDAHDDIDTKIYTSAKPDIHKTVSPKNHQPMKHDIRKWKSSGKPWMNG